MTLCNVFTRRGLTLSDVRLNTQIKNQSIIMERNACVEIPNITFIMIHYFQCVMVHNDCFEFFEVTSTPFHVIL